MLRVTAGHGWAQVTVPTGRQEIKPVAASLRRCGWQVTVASMGYQSTDTGLWKMSLFTIKGDTVDEQIVRNVFNRYGLIVQ